ncbi:MAG: ABC transporter ATP-binding protein [Gemmataceae bacterium]
MTPAIRTRDLVKTFPGKPPVEAVRGIHLDVAPGQCFGLLGPNGAGKTTTLEMIEGLLEPTSGTIEVLGLTWGRDDAQIRQRMGISLQETRLSDKLTVRETVTLFRSFYPGGIAPDDAIAIVSLQEKARAYVDKLSGGQKQRLAVACALVGDPELLFLDEPTTGLDPQSRRQLWEIVRDLRNRGRTIILTTHYMDEAERLCDDIAIVDQGQIIARGSPRQLIQQLGAEHIIELTVEPELSIEKLADLPGVRTCRFEAGRLLLNVDEPHIALPAVLDRIRQLDAKLAGLSTRSATLEDVFVSLTGRHLRDTGPES